MMRRVSKAHRISPAHGRVGAHQGNDNGDDMETLLLRDHEVAKLINVSKTKAYLMMRSGEIPGVVRIGRCIRVHRGVLEKWIADQAA